MSKNLELRMEGIFLYQKNYYFILKIRGQWDIATIISKIMGHEWALFLLQKFYTKIIFTFILNFNFLFGQKLFSPGN